MAKQGISTGTTPNDGTGDSLLDGALKINSNFTEIYDTLGDGSTIGSNANFTGVVTATSFDGELVGSAVTSYSGGLTVTGVTTSTGGFVGTLTGNVTGTASTATVAVNAQGLTGSPNVTVGNINVGTAITIGSGNTQTTNSIELTGTVDSVSVITDRLNSGIATFTENVYLGDSDHLYFGDGSDLDIYHSGTDNFIVGSTGVIHMRNDDIKIQSGAGNTNYARFRDTGVELYQDTYKRFETTDAGIKVTGGVEATGVSTFSGNVDLGDNDRLRFGTDADGVEIYHDGSNSYILNDGVGSLLVNTDDFFVKSSDNSQSMLRAGTTDVELYYGGSEKLATVNDGVTVTGTVISDQLNVSGVVTATSFSGSLAASNLTGALPAIDGSALTGVVGSGSGVIIEDSGSVVGTAGTINFGDNLTVSPISVGIVTVTATGGGGGYWVSTAAGIHTLSNVGIGTTNPTSDLTVSGDVNVSGVSTFNNDVTVDGGNLTFTSQGDQLKFTTAASNPASGGCIEIQTSATSTATISGNANQLKIYNNDNSSNSIDLRAATYSIQDENVDYYALFYNGQVRLYHPDTAGGITDQKFETTDAGIKVTGGVEATGVSTFQGNVNLGDNDRLRIGDGNDLQIYHDGSTSYIKDTGTGSLLITTNGAQIRLRNSSEGEEMANFIRNGAVELYYDNSKKFETTDTGIKVTGGVEATGVSTFSDGGSRFTSIQNDAITFNSLDNSASIQGTGYGGLSISPGGPGDSISIATYGIFSSGGDVTFNNGVSQRTTTIGGRLRVTGISTFQDDLIVGTATTGIVVTPEGNLNVSGISTFNKNLILDNGSSDIRLQHNISGTEKSKLIFRSSGAIDYYANNGMNFYATDSASPINRRLQLLTAGGVKVEYKNSTRLETTSAGVDITGTLDVSGISTFSGNVSVGVDTSVGVVLTSPNGTKYRLMVENDGSLATVAI